VSAGRSRFGGLQLDAPEFPDAVRHYLIAFEQAV
jgi:hypothetical protein